MLHICIALATAVLNEVLYDPDGADAGREFVEILNVSDSTLSLAGLELEAGDGARPGTWRLAWRGTSGEIAPGALLLVAAESLGTTQRLVADLQNGPDAVRLRRGTEVLDLLGYGAVPPDLAEGRPAPDVAGRSLARWPDGRDTGDNASDFVVAAPTPGRRNLPRRDLAVALVEPDPTRSWPGRRIGARITVRNSGQEPAAAGSWQLRAALRRSLADSLAAEPLVAPLPPALAAGESAASLLEWVATRGLFQLEARVVPADEDSTNDAASVWVRVGAGPVVVNEILFAPESGGGEWVELWNRDAAPHDLAGWTLSDATGRPAHLRAARPLGAGAYAIAGADTTAVVPELAAGTLRVAATPWNALNDTDADDGFADRLVLRDAGGVVQDAVRYSSRASRERGRSLERLMADPDVRGLLWAPCKARERATPGRANSATAPPGRSARVDLEPNPFSPDGDGHAELLGLAIEVPEGYEGFRARIFDLGGRCRATLGADRLGPGPRHLAWDGRSDEGTALPRGVYVLDTEVGT